VRAAVTGATGLLGRHLVRALRARGDDVVLVPRGALPPADADVTFHLAAQTTVPAARADPVGTFEANVALAWRVLAAARRAVFASSDQVYGPRAPVPTPEDAPLRPDGPYAASKAAADVLARQLPGVVVARLVNVYGPGDRQTSRLVPGTIAAVRAGRRPVIRGDGTAARDLLYVDDAVAALLALAEHGEPGEAYNVGTGRAHRVRDVVDAILRVAGSELEPEVLGDAPPGEGGRRAVSTAKIRAATGWTATTSLQEGLRRTWRAGAFLD
jgi:nucleoside-diphosphate-sugar epimerase